MRTLLQRTLQAVLDAEIATNGTIERGTVAETVDARTLITRLGPIRLRAPLRNTTIMSGLGRRFTAAETSLLLLLGRLIIRAEATPETVRDIAERLSGHAFEASRLARIILAVDHALADYLRREFENGWADYARNGPYFPCVTRNARSAGSRRSQPMVEISPFSSSNRDQLVGAA